MSSTFLNIFLDFLHNRQSLTKIYIHTRNEIRIWLVLVYPQLLEQYIAVQRALLTVKEVEMEVVVIQVSKNLPSLGLEPAREGAEESCPRCEGSSIL